MWRGWEGMGSRTFPRSPATAFWVAYMLWFNAFPGGMLRVASHHEDGKTDPMEVQALLAFKAGLDDPNGSLESWVNTTDPCDSWKWIVCDGEDTSQDADPEFRHLTSLRLLSLNLSGQLDDNLAELTELTYLDVMRNRLSGSIPASIGRLTNMKILLLSGNQFSGVLPPELGNLTKMTRLQLDENKFSGQIPSTFFTLTEIWHIHMNNNSLNGSIPEGLGRLPYLLHVLVDNNQLTGPLPDDLASAPNLRVIQLDNNPFSGIPASFTRIPTLQKLSMRNCSLSGSLPDFNESTRLAVLDLSRNNLTGSLPTFALPVNITSVDLSHNKLQGAVPESFGNLQNLEYLELSNNNLSGEIAANLGLGRSFNESGRVILDFQNNSLELASGSVLPNIYSQPDHELQVWFSGNPIACPPNTSINNPFCVPNSIDRYLTLDLPHAQSNWGCPRCISPEQLRPTPSLGSPICSCASPIIISYRLKSPPFALFDTYEIAFRETIADELELSIDQVGINSTEYELGPRIKLGLFIFPMSGSDNRFNRSEADRITKKFYNWDLPENIQFGPYEILGIKAPPLPSAVPSPVSDRNFTGVIVGVVCSIVLVSAVLSALGMYCWLRRHGSGKFGRRMCQTPINVPGVRSFTFVEMTKATSNFRNENLLGEGGYGNVYFGTLEDGQKVAVKRAAEGSLQGREEFENEIQLLSRVHHRNLVILVGYCNDDGEHINGEQMLVYEFVPNRNLQEHLVSADWPALDIISRLRIAIGSARGIQYLHTEANPPVFHRDIKSTNILLDRKYNAKVSDFGLSKLAMIEVDIEGVHKGHVSTVVKGTPGYLDPEYFLTHQLTDKSDVYSFGVVLLELISGLPPIVNGKNLTREVNAAYREGDVMSIIDPRMGSYSMETIKCLIKLALSCVDNDTTRRPSMTEVSHELEEIWREAPWSDTASVGYPGDESTELLVGLQKSRRQVSWKSDHESSSSPFLDESTPRSIEMGKGMISQTHMQLFPR